MDNPRVFDGGAMTLVVAQNGVSVYAGRHQVKMFNSINMSLSDDGAILLEIRFGRSHDSEIECMIDENARLASTIPGVTVIR